MHTIRPHLLPALVGDIVAAGAKVLSLDCFDTLIWRLTHRPTDVFAAAGMALRPSARIHAEHEARRLRQVRDGLDEVGIRDIYARALAGTAAVDAAVQAELAAEHAHCYAFPPTVELIRRAHAAGLRVIVVSDTYLSQAQLRELMTSAAGKDTAALIERIYCSCEYGVSKSGGLFRKVLDDLRLPPQRVVHVGDHRLADYESAGKLGIPARHLQQFDPATEQQLRLESNIVALIDPLARASRPVYQPQRALLASGLPAIEDSAERLGYAVVGPVLAGFAAWLRSEARSWQAEGAAPKLLFLMRDGHLPLQVYRGFAAAGDAPSFAVEISRFTAFGAGMRTPADIDEYLAANIGSARWLAMARHLHYHEHEAQALARRVERAADPRRRFLELIRRESSTQLILARASQLRERLAAHLTRAARLDAGDRVMLVDLGYAGTVQDRIEPWLREDLGLDVRGRYMIQRDVQDRYDSKRGFIGVDLVDGRAINTLCDHIALFEQLCAVNQGSVIDYAADGQPLRRDSGLASRQSEVRLAVQRGCCRYVADMVHGDAVGSASVPLEASRQAGAAALARLLFLPSADELALFKGFEHDVNMGVDDKVLLFDPEACRTGLRDRGLFYVNNNPRQLLPAELRRSGLPLTLTLLAQRRFDLDLRLGDFSLERITLPIMVADPSRSTLTEIEALPTHDGFFAARIPIGHSQYAIGILFGRHFERLQLAAASVTRDIGMFAGPDDAAIDVLGEAVHEEVVDEGSGLLHYASPAAFTYFHPHALDRRQRYVLNVVFRPLQSRAREQAKTATPVH
jgi:FMN phosphatase YigB (HAD superfamily)